MVWPKSKKLVHYNVTLKMKPEVGYTIPENKVFPDLWLKKLRRTWVEKLSARR
jgi:hypothetical protein